MPDFKPLTGHSQRGDVLNSIRMTQHNRCSISPRSQPGEGPTPVRLDCLVSLLDDLHCPPSTLCVQCGLMVLWVHPGSAVLCVHCGLLVVCVHYESVVMCVHHGSAGISAQGLRLIDCLTPQPEASTSER